MDGGQMSQKKILLVEDDADQMMLITALLESASFRVVQAHDGKDAIRKAESNNVDIVVSDVALPHLNGLELAASLNNSPATAKLPIILVTAGSDLLPFSDVKFRAADFCLKKNITSLVDKVNSVLGDS